MGRPLRFGGAAQLLIGFGEGVALFTSRAGIAGRQLVSRCLAISVLLHILLAVSIAPGIDVVGPSRESRGSAANRVLQGVLLARVSSKGDHGSANERPLGRVEPLPTRSAADTPAPAPTPPAPQLRVRAKMPEPNILPLASPYYFRASELEVRPRVVSQVQPRFPDAAIGTVSGKVVLRLKISESGHVDSALIERSDLPQAFQDSAIEAFTNAVAAPGEIGGIAVKSQMLVEVAFDQGS